MLQTKVGVIGGASILVATILSGCGRQDAAPDQEATPTADQTPEFLAWLTTLGVDTNNLLSASAAP